VVDNLTAGEIIIVNRFPVKCTTRRIRSDVFLLSSVRAANWPGSGRFWPTKNKKQTEKPYSIDIITDPIDFGIKERTESTRMSLTSVFSNENRGRMLCDRLNCCSNGTDEKVNKQGRAFVVWRSSSTSNDMHSFRAYYYQHNRLIGCRTTVNCGTQ